MTSRHLLLALCVTLGACGAPSGGTDSGPSGGTDAGSPGTDAGSPGTDAGGPVVVHDCADADFVDLSAGAPDDRMIMVPRGTFTFDTPCITVSAGQVVMFMWDFSVHPLAPGVAPGHPGTGTEPSPIAAQTTGVLYEPAFPSAGDYPFYCATHYHSGMYGVVRVVP